MSAGAGDLPLTAACICCGVNAAVMGQDAFGRYFCLPCAAVLQGARSPARRAQLRAGRRR